MISGSILSSELDARKLVGLFEMSDVDYIHLDIMDGKFTENKTWTFSEIWKLCSLSSKKFDTHLMVSKPSKYIKDYALLNNEYITFHLECDDNIDDVINLIKSYGVRVGISINPDTNISKLFPYLSVIDLILVMSVVPGKSGQLFIEESVERIRVLRSKIDELGVNVKISVDGGINEDTAKLCVDAGCDMLVSASYLHKDIKNNVKILKSMFWIFTI